MRSTGEVMGIDATALAFVKVAAAGMSLPKDGTVHLSGGP